MTRKVLLVEIGAGALPDTTPVSTVRGSWVPAVYTPPELPGPELAIVGGIVTINCKYSDFHLLLNANVTGVEFINADEYDVVTVDIEQTGAFTVAFGPTCTPITGSPYLPSATIGAVDVIGFKTFDGGDTWRYTVQQPDSGSGAPLAVTLAPDPASNVYAGDGVTPGAPSVQVTATVEGGVVPLTHQWTRVDAGGTNFLIDDATAAAPTFSIAAGVDPFSATQEWRDTVTDGEGGTAQATADITLQRTSPLTTGDWDGATANVFSYRVRGTSASASATLTFKPDGTWELRSSNAGVVDSGQWGAGVVGAEYEVRFTPTPAGGTNGAPNYVPLSAERSFSGSVTAYAYEGIVSQSYDVLAELRRIDTPGTVASGTVDINLSAELDPDAL